MGELEDLSTQGYPHMARQLTSLGGGYDCDSARREGCRIVLSTGHFADGTT